MIERTRQIYTEKRIRFSNFDKRYNRLCLPFFVWAKDKRFQSQYRDQDILISQGEVVFAHIIQANTLLFQPGSMNHPAAILFSRDRYFDDHLEELLELGHNMFDLKGQTLDDPELKKFAEVITDEMTALLNVKLPKKITGNREVYYTTIMLHRKHMPLGYLKTGWFPVLVLPDRTEACMFLPERYWDREMLELWKMD